MDLSSLSSKLLPGFTTLGFREERRSRGETPRPYPVAAVSGLALGPIVLGGPGRCGSWSAAGRPRLRVCQGGGSSLRSAALRMVVQ